MYIVYLTKKEIENTIQIRNENKIFDHVIDQGN